MHADIRNAITRLPEFYDSALKSENLPAALDILAELTGARGVLLYAHDRGIVEYSENLTNSIYAGKQHLIEDHMRRFARYELQAMIRIAQGPPNKVQIDEEVYLQPIEVLESRGDFVNTLETMDVFRRMAVRFDTGTHLHSGVILQYPSHLREVPQPNIDMIEFIAPHLSKAIEINRFYSPLRARYNAVLTVLDRMSVGICVTTPTATVTIANATAQATLDEGRHLRRDGHHRLICAAEQVTDALRDAIARVSGTANGEDVATGFELPLHRPGEDAGDLLLVVAPLRDANAELERGYVGALVMIVDPASSYRMNLGPFAALNGLTEAEAEIADLLVIGCGIEEIAERRNVVPETIRSQVKSIYAKTGVRNRPAFMWKAVQYAPPVL